MQDADENESKTVVLRFEAQVESYGNKGEMEEEKYRPRAILVAERLPVAISGDTPNTHSLLTNIPASAGCSCLSSFWLH